MKRKPFRVEQLNFVSVLSANDESARQPSFCAFIGEDIDNSRKNRRRDVTQPAEGIPVLRLDARAPRTVQKIVHPNASVTATAKLSAGKRAAEAKGLYFGLYFTVRIEPSRD